MSEQTSPPMTLEPNQPDLPKRLGTKMVVAAWLLLLILMTWLFQGKLDQQANPNRDIQGVLTSDGTREVQLQRNRNGHYVANGEINGQPVEFLLDTGATVVTIPGQLARTLQLKVGAPQLSRTANGTVRTYATEINQIRLGNISLNSVRASINPHMEGDQILLGMSFLQRLELIQRNGTLTVRQHLPVSR